MSMFFIVIYLRFAFSFHAILSDEPIVVSNIMVDLAKSATIFRRGQLFA